MARTDKFRVQHEEILKAARDIAALLPNGAERAVATEIYLKLSKLSGAISVHLAMEDKVLYPALMEAQDNNLKNTARRYSDEMGELAKVYMDFTKAWPSSSAIQADPARFSSETRNVFNALAKRIHMENTELYVMADKLQ